MRTSTIVTALALGAGLLAGGVYLAPSFAQDNRPASVGERQWLSIPRIHDKLDAAGYRDIEEIEREHGGYEVRATNRDGERVKLYLDPHTGEIFDKNRRDQDRNDRLGRADGKRRAADCTERRCRDDLPPPKVATPVGVK